MALPKTALVSDDYTAIVANTMVTFAAGETAKTHTLTLTTDKVVEGIEYFEVVISDVAGAGAAKGDVHAVLNTAKVFIVDHSCK
jgi:hypothetical protein